MSPRQHESLSAYVRRSKGDCDGRDYHWLADEIQVLEDALAWRLAREQPQPLPRPTREELLGDG